ncbi:MAG: DUF1120 domain-containing protein [Cupriavidus sp.]|nr:DUF1120 domain-containing protein [Cupriavidus pauculus]MBU67859.1 DUF1120 domain-containing protein [Cupriavidus sp.]
MAPRNVARGLFSQMRQSANMRKPLTWRSVLAIGAAMVPLAGLPEDTMNLTMGGKSLPSACDVSLSGNGRVDFGLVLADALQPSSPTHLAARTVTLTVACDGPTRLAIATRESRAGTAAAEMDEAVGAPSVYSVFGLGALGGTNLGGYGIRYASPLVDGEPGSMLFSANLASGWSRVGTASDQSGGFAYTLDGVYYSWTQDAGYMPGAFTTVIVPMTVTAAVVARSALPTVMARVPLEGIATVSLVYL